MWTHHSTRRCHANSFDSRTASVRWLWEHSDSHGCVFQISICLPYIQPETKTIAKVITNIMTKHAYLLTTMISDKGYAFIFHVIKRVAEVLGITPKHAKAKHAQTIGVLERMHASLNKALKIETGWRRSMWHKYVSAVLNHNTSYHTSNGCERIGCFSDAFHTTS